MFLPSLADSTALCWSSSKHTGCGGCFCVFISGLLLLLLLLVVVLESQGDDSATEKGVEVEVVVVGGVSIEDLGHVVGFFCGDVISIG